MRTLLLVAAVLLSAVLAELPGFRPEDCRKVFKNGAFQEFCSSNFHHQFSGSPSNFPPFPQRETTGNFGFGGPPQPYGPARDDFSNNYASSYRRETQQNDVGGIPPGFKPEDCKITNENGVTWWRCKTGFSELPPGFRPEDCKITNENGVEWRRCNTNSASFNPHNFQPPSNGVSNGQIGGFQGFGELPPGFRPEDCRITEENGVTWRRCNTNSGHNSGGDPNRFNPPPPDFFPPSDTRQKPIFTPKPAFNYRPGFTPKPAFNYNPEFSPTPAKFRPVFTPKPAFNPNPNFTPTPANYKPVFTPTPFPSVPPTNFPSVPEFETSGQRDMCVPLSSRRLSVVCYTPDNKPTSCDKSLPTRSYARFRCREGIYIKIKEPNYREITCQNGRWDRSLPEDICEPECGRPVQKFAQPAVANGITAEYGQFPWHAGIYEYIDREKDYKHICGGSLISHNVLVTAAHCLVKENNDRTLERKDKNRIQIGMGKYMRELKSAEESYRQILKVQSILVSGEYFGSQGRYADDIAMVVMQTSVEFSPAVLPICLDIGDRNMEDDQLFDGAVGLVTGWGLTENGEASDKLQVASMPYIPRDKCMKKSMLTTWITNDKMCGGDPSTKITACRGDSGGGYVFQDVNTRHYYLRGIVSLGEQGSCPGNDYVLFTKISTHASFIGRVKGV